MASEENGFLQIRNLGPKSRIAHARDDAGAGPALLHMEISGGTLIVLIRGHQLFAMESLENPDFLLARYGRLRLECFKKVLEFVMFKFMTVNKQKWNQIGSHS